MSKIINLLNRSNWLLLLAFVAFSCDHEQVNSSIKDETTTEAIILNQNSENSSARQITDTGINCDESETFDLYTGDIPAGIVTVNVSATSVDAYFDVSDGGWFLLNIALYAGDCDSIPENIESYSYYEEFIPEDEIRTANASVDMTNLPACGCLRMFATVAYYNSQTSGIESIIAESYSDYCNCDDDEPEEPVEPDDKNLRTQTPGGWGAPPRGTNPGMYLHSNFDTAFPAGLSIGCDYTMEFTSAQAITDYLPSGGKPAALTMDYTDPVKNPKNTLASHVISLTLSTTFDQWDADFGESNTNLANAVITSGDFMGWTVADVLAEANKILGGCDSDYSASQIQDAISKINESFVDGTTNTGYLMNGN